MASRGDPSGSYPISFQLRHIDMIRKAHPTDMSAMDPTPEQIRERSLEIRNRWTPRERARRQGFKRANWMPPVISELEFPAGAGEFDSN